MSTPAFNVSFSPEDFTRGLIDDIRAKVVTAKIMVFKAKPESKGFLAAVLGLALENGKIEEQAWSLGGKAHESYEPTPDGDSVQPKPGSGKTSVAINEKSAFALLCRELVNVGFPNDRLKAARISNLVGIDAHWKRVKQDKFTAQDGKEIEQDPLLPAQLFAAPGGVNPVSHAQGNGGAVVVPGMVPGASADAALSAAKAAVMGAIVRAGGRISLADMSLSVWNALDGDPMRAEIMRAVTMPSFQTGGPWKNEGGMLTF